MDALEHANDEAVDGDAVRRCVAAFEEEGAGMVEECLEESQKLAAGRGQLPSYILT